MDSVGIVRINRSKLFNPADFIAAGWTSWQGPFDGDGCFGNSQEDPQSLKLTEVCLYTVRLETMLEGCETLVSGKEKLDRLKLAGYVRLDASIFQVLFENQHLIPEHWKEKVCGKAPYISFDGTELRGSDGKRYVLCLCWEKDNWEWSLRRRDDNFHRFDLSAVLPRQFAA